jgi:hypothetical protein
MLSSMQLVITMIRTQISLDERAYREAKAEAKRLSISLAEFLRRAVAAALAPTQQAAGKRPWMRYAGIGASGDPRASETVDEVVYGRERP